MDKFDFNKNALKKSNLKAQFDPVEYVQYLDGMDLTDEEAKEMLMTLWDMMVQFVDLGFDVECNSGKAQQNTVQPACAIESENKETSKATSMGEKR